MPSTTRPVALITGAGSGIGRQVAFDLGTEGYAIAAVDLHEDALTSLAGELTKQGVPNAWAVVDVTAAAEHQAAVADLERQLGPVELLVASAGIGLETSGLNYRADDVARVINVNLIGVSNSIGAVLPGMLQRGRGHLVALSSVASFRGLPRMLGYSASKAGLNALMDGLRVEIEELGVHTTTVCPGWIRTPMTAQIQGKLDYLLDVQEASRHIVQAIRTRAPFYCFPRRLAWRLQLLTWLPRRWQDRMIRKMLSRLETRKGL